MQVRSRRTTWLVLLAAALAPTIARADAPNDGEFFEREIRPLLIQHCYKCHGELKEPKGGLALTSREAVLRGGDSGPAAVAGKPAESLLVAAVKHDGLEMPPESDKLADAQVASLARWVELGLPWPAADAAALKRARHLAADEQIAEVRRTFWSFQPIKRPPPPTVKNAAWPQTAIDHFVLAELERRGLAPSPPADRPTLLRRLSFDLLGLPPTPEEIDAFVTDDVP